MSNKYWMTLDHPTAQIFLEEDGPLKFRAWFTNLTQGELIKIVGRGLTRQTRFGNQLQQPICVMQHTEWLANFIGTRGIDKEGPNGSMVRHARFHDTPEAFGYGDIPKHFKMPIDIAREDAIFEAMKWPSYLLSESNLATFKYWDGIAGCAEAIKFGCYRWPWMERVWEERRHDVEHYLESLEELPSNREYLRHIWEQSVERYCVLAKTINRSYEPNEPEYPIHVPTH